MLKKDLVEYHQGETVLEGFCAYYESEKPKPVVLIAHDWSGRNEFAQQKAESLANLGYIGFAIDMYGKGKQGRTKEEKQALIRPLLEDRKLLLQRMMAAFNKVKEFSFVDSSRIGAIGFCFGGLCVLDLARSGADIKATVSFHGLLDAPGYQRQAAIISKILALHGYDDPMVTPDKIQMFGDEMTAAKADWQFTIYGQTMHAFTNPEANDPAFGTVYSKPADTRSWIAMREFFKETF